MVRGQIGAKNMLFIRESMRNGFVKCCLGVFTFAVVMVAADPVLAECSKSGTLGALICNTFNSSHGIPAMLAGISYLFGLVLGFIGILKLREHVENPNQVQIWDSMKRFLAAGSFFVIPYIGRVVHDTIAADGENLTGNKYKSDGVSGDGLDAKLVALMKDVWEPMQYLMLGFSYLAGIILIMIGISRLMKSEQEGARGPMGIGTIMTFLVAGVLLSLNKTLGATVTSIFDSGAKNQALLTYAVDGDAKKHAEAVIGAIFAFVALLGWVSFIRGFFIMRSVAEGNSQASAMAGMTHILGGAVAVNLGAFIQAVQNSLQITKYGVEISSLEPYLTTVAFFA